MNLNDSGQDVLRRRLTDKTTGWQENLKHGVHQKNTYKA